MSLKTLKLSCFTTTSALGNGNRAALEALQTGQTGLTANDFPNCDLQTYIGRVTGLEQVHLPEALAEFDCRNNRLTCLGLQQDGFSDSVQQARARYGSQRIGVFLGTSTSGIQQTELAYTNMEEEQLAKDFNITKTHNVFSLADFTQQYFALNGSAHVVSTACSSSARVFASAYRHMLAGFCDAAIVGGADSLCLTTLYGFNSLQLVSPDLCQPWDTQRKGINIGEAAGFALLEWDDNSDPNAIQLLGYGESSDAYHMSTPHPQGRGAAQAMQAALDKADLSADRVDYINLHGTSTQSNDSSEDRAVMTVFGEQTPCSSTKGWTGHTLGAAGITEVIFGCLAIQHGFMPANLNLVQKDPQTHANILTENRCTEVNRFISNSFGFGGSNCSLLIGRSG